MSLLYIITVQMQFYVAAYSDKMCIFTWNHKCLYHVHLQILTLLCLPFTMLLLGGVYGHFLGTSVTWKLC